MENTKKFGFGFMRLPTLEDGQIDIETVKSMVDSFMSNGYNYFDTAFNYMESKSEDAIKETLVDRYKRDSFLLADKLPMWVIKEKSDIKRVFDTQLKRTGAKYFDYYLLHAVNKDIFQKANEFGAWEFLKQMKTEGKIRHLGFSFHDTAETLKEILDVYTESEFVQLQINYMDWESESVQSRRCFEVAKQYSKDVIVMEPIKGGSLSQLSNRAKEILNEYEPDWSLAKWAMNFVTSQNGVDLVLSGVSNIDQLNENIDIFNNLNKLQDKHYIALDKVVKYLLSLPTIPCTACKYCVDGCPANIPIPDIIKLINSYTTYGNITAPKRLYDMKTKNLGKASDCIKCGQCEEHCPQHLKIIDVMKYATECFEK